MQNPVLTALFHNQMDTLVRVAVASKAKVKLSAVRDAFTSVFKSLDVTGESCPSLINEQPYGHEETLLGARNRLKAALAITMSRHPRPDYVVSMENGIVDMAGGSFDLVNSASCPLARYTGFDTEKVSRAVRHG